MIRKQCLSIYMQPESLTAALFERSEDRIELRETWKIAAAPPVAEAAEESPAESPADQNSQANDNLPGEPKNDLPPELPGTQLIDQLAQRFSESPAPPPTILTLSGRFYQSQGHHSDFVADNQIRQTLRFDIEEEFSADGEAIAICYQHQPAPVQGSDLIVHTVDRDQLIAVLDRLYCGGLDAMVAMPDLESWCQFLKHQTDLVEGEVYLAVAKIRDVMTIILYRKNAPIIMGRTFLCDDAGFSQIVAGELRRCLTMLDTVSRPTRWVYHSLGLTPDQIAELEKHIALPGQPLAQPDPALAFAWGAAVSWLDGEHVADFREDRLTPKSLTQGRTNALYKLSGAVSVLLAVLAAIFYLNIIRYYFVERHVEKQLAKAWTDTQPNEEPVPKDTRTISKKIKTTAAEITKKKQGAQNGESASYTLKLVLEFINDIVKATPENQDKPQTKPASDPKETADSGSKEKTKSDSKEKNESGSKENADSGSKEKTESGPAADAKEKTEVKKASDSKEKIDMQIDSLRVHKVSANLSGSVPDMKALGKIGDILNKSSCPLFVDNWNFVLQNVANSRGEQSNRRTFNLPLRVRAAVNAPKGEAKKNAKHQ